MIDQGYVKLGELESVYHVKGRMRSTHLIVAVLVTAAIVFWLIRYVDAPLCVPVPLFAFGWVVVEFLTKLRTELKIFANGLTYQRLYRNHTVFWTEVEEYGHILREDYLLADLRDETGAPLPKAGTGRGYDTVWLETHAGKRFYLRADLENIKSIIDEISIKLYGEPYYGEPKTLRRKNDA